MRIISGTAKGKKILIPVDKKTRPLRDMVRESIFNILNHSNLLKFKLDKCTVLDLFSGVGTFGLEAISRGAKKVIFFEDYNPAIKLLIKNINNLEFHKQAKINKKNIYLDKELKKLNYKFDIVFLDPPFRDKNLKLLLKSLSTIKSIKSETLVIIHRHKNTNDDFNIKFKIAREEFYGSSKIIFGFFIF